MAKKSRKKVAPKKTYKTKKSLVDKLFSIKKIFTYSLIITVAIFSLVYSSHGSQEVAGASTKDNYPVFTNSELINLANTNPDSIRISKYVGISLWRDKNANAKQDGSDTCLGKKFTFKINSVSKTVVQDSNCMWPARVKVTENCNTVEFVKTNTSNKYVYTGLVYTDSKHDEASSKSKKITVCGFPLVNGGDNGVGYAYNLVEFGVKAE